MNTILSIAAAAATLLAAPASAQRTTAETRATVSRADLDLRRERDVRTLDRRVARAAQLVCGETSHWDVAGTNAIRRCRSATIAAFTPQRARLIAVAKNEPTTALSSR